MISCDFSLDQAVSAVVTSCSPELTNDAASNLPGDSCPDDPRHALLGLLGKHLQADAQLAIRIVLFRLLAGRPADCDHRRFYPGHNGLRWLSGRGRPAAPDR